MPCNSCPPHPPLESGLVQDMNRHETHESKLVWSFFRQEHALNLNMSFFFFFSFQRILQSITEAHVDSHILSFFFF